jgi:hypothetical protein
MELLIALGAFIVVDYLAVRFGNDSRPMPVKKDDAHFPHDN